MELTVLGSGSCELVEERSSCSHLLTSQNSCILLDMGFGSLRRFLDLGHKISSLKAVLFTHHHIDHMADLLPLLFAGNYDDNFKNSQGLHIILHEEFQPILKGLHDVFGDWLKVDPNLIKLVYIKPNETFYVNDLKIRTAKMNHQPTSLAYRIENSKGRVLVYLGDGKANSESVEFCSKADLLVVNAASGKGAHKPGHMNPAMAGQLAEDAKVKKLVLSHIYQAIDEKASLAICKEYFSGKIYLAEDFFKLNI